MGTNCARVLLAAELPLPLPLLLLLFFLLFLFLVGIVDCPRWRAAGGSAPLPGLWASPDGTEGRPAATPIVISFSIHAIRLGAASRHLWRNSKAGLRHGPTRVERGERAASNLTAE